MNERIAHRRTRNRRHARGGYTLIELMVVVVLVALLAMMAAPSFVTARSDRLAFSYARTVGELVHNARARAEARGAAHLFVFTDHFGARGTALVFEALDGTPSTATPAGPNPVPSCKTPGQWTDVTTWSTTAAASNNINVIDALNINDTAAGAIEVKENITMLASQIAPTTATPTTFVMCITPNGTTYYGYGADIATAITSTTTGMMVANPFTGIVEVDVARHDSSSNIVGLKRRVILAGSAAPRVKSE